MKYKIDFTNKAIKDLKKLDKGVSKIILSWIKKHLENCENPRQYGKALVGNRSGQWRYRIGDYRLITEIQDDKVIILIVEIGHRKNIYN